MVTCMNCHKFVTELQFGGWCLECLVSVGIKPENMGSPLVNRYNIIPSCPAIISNQGPQVNLAPPLTEKIPCAGSKAHFRNIGKAKRTKIPAPTPFSRNPLTSATPTENSIRMLKCGIIFYQDDKPKKTGIMSYMQQVDISVPNLYHTLQQQLWKLFSPELIRKELVEALPNNPINCTALSANKSVLDADTLLLLVGQSTMKKPLQIDLVCEDGAGETDTTERTTATERPLRNRANLEPNIITPPVATQPNEGLTSLATSRSNVNDTLYIPTTITARPNDGNWALGGTSATVPARGRASLSTHMRHLGRPLSSSLNINPGGWVLANRLKFNHLDVEIGRNSHSLPRYHHLKATTVPETVKIDRNLVLGSPSEIVPNISESSQPPGSVKSPPATNLRPTTGFGTNTINPVHNRVAIAGLLSTELEDGILPSLNFFGSELNQPTDDRAVNTSER
ncbi:hypothetical protein PtA15_1A910 [Puccinia triticina]|uniref:ZZ-type domain-containing protein n=1 Tax=Puccinia triticina TaxID=208348 RepID=A0ABY7CB04_9BASI|nr:uncharacterized protein PtA15_1A910 [Puccinia triticina]WAQ81568.1 hypothetical protein PtA15_1A910 [Puccinia triticina]